MNESCGGAGTYLPNFKTMHIANSKMPSKETPFLERITNLTDFISDHFEPDVDQTADMPEFFASTSSDALKIKLAVQPTQCQQENIVFVFSMEERYKRRNLHRILRVFETKQSGKTFLKTIFMVNNVDPIGRFRFWWMTFEIVVLLKITNW